ncbi:MAG: MBL fold metallo-hydrolase [Deltaproteobacteria bacterium]|nr:MBL fold metallo-hydrolase [Deltaproteobacteria bacterium]
MNRIFTDKLLQLIVLALACCHTAVAEEQFKDVEIKSIKAADGVYMLTGKGGNLGLSVGDDGVFLIDDQFAPLTGKIQAAIARLSDKPVRFVLNTHWHPDHTGGIAHDNVRTRLSVDNFIEMFQMDAPAMPKTGLPVITFNEAITFHINNDDIRAWHVEHAHTDGDAIVHFRQANVIHTGDTYFAGMYPFIDTGSGGSADGVIRAIDQVLEIADEKTVIIPGHGPISNRQELATYRDMLKTISESIKARLRKGASLEQIQADGVTADFDAAYGAGFIKNEQFVEMLYKDLSR